jgi:RNase P subunit RPR2
MERDSMQRDICDRCKQPPIDNTTIMSKFNTQVICTTCKDKEKEHTDYEAACKAENQAIDKGDRYFKGIGLPDDL